MKILITVFTCCLFFISGSIAQTLSFPKAIGYSSPVEQSGKKLTEDDYLEPIGYFVETFRPIGWSSDGKFAYAAFSIDHNSDLIMSITVQNMISDDIVWDEEFSFLNTFESNDYLDKIIDEERWNEVPEKQLWDAVKVQVAKKLEKHKIRQEKKVDFRRGTWHRINGQPYKFAPQVRRSTEVPGYMGEIQVDCRAKGLGKKTIFESEVDFDNKSEYYVAGIIKSPYQDRVAVVCHFIKSGFDDSTDTYSHLIGCNLKNGFK